MYMNRILSKIVIAGIWALVALPIFFPTALSAARQKPQTVTQSRDSILVGERVVISTRLSVPDGTPLVAVPYSNTLQSADTIARTGADTSLQKLSSIEVLKELTLDTLSLKKGIREIDAKVMVTSFDTGVFKLPMPQVLTSGSQLPDNISFYDKLLTVSTVQIDTTGFVMSDIKGQIEYPITFKEVLPWIAAALALIAVIYLVYRYIKHRRENRGFFGKQKVADPPHIVALRELEKIRNQKLWQSGKEKVYYTGITDTLREYIEQRFGLTAKEKTSSEILEELKTVDLDKKSYEELSGLFSVSDLVKFAKYSPSVGENEEAVPTAVRFVNSTFMTQMAQETTESVEDKNE